MIGAPIGLPEGVSVRDADEARALAAALLRWADEQEACERVLPPADPLCCSLCGKDLEGGEEGICMDCAFLYLEAPRGRPTLLSEILQSLEKDMGRVGLDLDEELNRHLGGARRTAQLLPATLQSRTLELLKLSATRTMDDVRRDVARLVEEAQAR